MMAGYAFKKWYLKILIGFYDFLGSLFFQRPKSSLKKPWQSVLVIRLDHLGDVVLTEPFLKILKERHPESHITFLTSSLGREMFKSLSYLDSIQSFDPHWFSRKKGFWASFRDYRRLKSIIRHVHPDVVLDLRGDLRHIQAARSVCPDAWIAGYSITGGRFLLDCDLGGVSNGHAVMKNLNFLSCFGIPIPDFGDVTFDRRIAHESFDAKIQNYLPKKQRKWIAIHPAAGMSYKEWPMDYWVDLLHTINEKLSADVFWIGEEGVRKRVNLLMSRTDRLKNIRFYNLCGVLPIKSLGTFLSQCDLLISPDSGPVHVASIYHVASIVLYGHTNIADEWKPVNPNAYLISESPITNIKPKTVHETLISVLK